MFKKLRDTAVMPVRATQGSAGYDFALAEDILIHAGEKVLIPSGIAFEEDCTGLHLQMHPRSSMWMKHGLVMPFVGIIDSDYKDEIFIPYENTSDRVVILRAGERIAQGIFQQFFVYEGEETPLNAEREGGHGSTGA